MQGGGHLQCSAPRSDPANKAFLRLSAIGLTARSTLNDAGVDLDAAILDEATESLPAGEHIADRFRELGLLAD